MYPISKGFPQTDRIYEEMIFLVNNDDEKFTNNLLNNTEENHFPILRLSALEYIENAFKVLSNEHIEVSKDAIVKKFSSNSEIFDENALEMKPFSGNSYHLSPGTSLVGNIVGHASLIRTLLRYELHRINVQYYQWTNFELLPKVLVAIHAEYYKIDEINASIAKWIAYCEVQLEHPLNLNAFTKLLNILVDENEDENLDKKNDKGKIKKALRKINPFKKKNKKNIEEKLIGDQLNTNDEEVEKLFCESKNILLNFFILYMKNIHDYEIHNETESNETQYAAEHTTKVTTFNQILEIINRLEKVYMNDGISRMLPNKNDLYKLMIKNFENGTVEHLNKNIDKLMLNHNDDNEKRLSELIRVIRLAVEHRESFVADFDQNFRSFSDISISKKMYEIYDTQLTILVKPIVLEICKKKCCNENDDEFIQKEEISIKKLFELYCELEKFVNYGKQHFVDNKFETTQFYNWFAPGVDKFFKFFAFHTKTRITKTVESDHLKPDSDISKMSPSVIDTIQTLFSIKRNWDVLIGLTKAKEGNMLKRIVEQFCAFSKLYFETFLDKAKKCLESKNIDSFTIPVELSVSIANFKYFSENFEILIDELIRDRMTDQNVISKHVENSQQNIKVMINKFIEFSIQKLVPMIKQLLYEDIEENRQIVGNSLPNSVEQILVTFFDEFSEREFKKSKLILWQYVVKNIVQCVQFGLKTKKLPKFFSNLYIVFENLKVAFRYLSDDNFIEDVPTTRKVKNIESVLQRNRFSISELICQYYISRHERQQKFKKDGVNLYGNLSIKCFIYQNVLTIEIKMPENLVSIDEDGIKQPYIKILMIPKEKFSNPRKIKWQSKNIGNIASSRINITIKQDINVEESFIHFKVKDKESFFNMLGSFCASLNCFDYRNAEERNSRFLGEAFMSFRDIPEVTHGNDTQEVELTLTKLSSCDLESLKAINQSAKAGNKQANKFLKSLENNSHIKLKFDDNHQNDNNI